MKMFIRSLRIVVVYTSMSCRAMRIPMNIKTKKISKSLSPVMMSAMRIHTDKVSVIFSDINTFFIPLFLDERCFLSLF